VLDAKQFGAEMKGMGIAFAQLGYCRPFSRPGIESRDGRLKACDDLAGGERTRVTPGILAASSGMARLKACDDLAGGERTRVTPGILAASCPTLKGSNVTTRETADRLRGSR